ncbi:methyl-accepting chemotaxis protein, partial [Acidocella sp. MX-AZ02]|uniref:methyl-accepting chemotaxis protein n=2 Tax=unclassified Acidocella TaxID=2648610 RepID=UPI00028D6443
MKNQPIIVKFLAVLGVLGLVALIATGFVATQIRTVADRGGQINATSMQAALDVANANGALQRQHAALEWLLITLGADVDAQASKEITDARAVFDNSMTQAANLVPAQADALNQLRQRGDAAFDASCAKAEQMGNASTTLAGNEAAQTEFNQNCASVFPPLAQDLRAERDQLTQLATTQLDAVQRGAAYTMWTSLIGIVLALAAVAIGSYFAIAAWVSNPLTRLRDAMARLSGGDLAAEVPEMGRKDEVGQMAGAVMVFKQAGLEKQRVEEEARRTAATAEAERAQAAAAREQAAAMLAKVVESLADGLERLSVGDLMFRIDQQFSDEYEKLRTDFNKAVATLQQTMQQIAANAQGVRASAGEITQSSDDLARRTEQQAASLEETAAALEEITATVRKSSEGANEARGVVNEAKLDAERSGLVVGETVTAMGGIEESSKKISNIIGVIDEIAFQTNLLALNAGVEAARAGDAGRGFAVVATEVRALAQRSADAAKEIKTLINASGAQVQVGVRLVNETGQALTRIVEQVARLNVLVTDIAGSAQEQATGLAEVNSAVNQMDQVTQQNAAMVEESTAASHSLAAEADELA